MELIAEWVSGNIFIRPNKGDKGEVVKGHKHNFDHTTIVRRGSIHVKALLPNGITVERDFSGNGEYGHCLIKAGVEHEITYLEDDSEFWCVYSHTTPQATISQTYDGWGKAYV